MRHLPDSTRVSAALRHGRGAVSAPGSRYDSLEVVGFDDGWITSETDEGAPIRTMVSADASRTVIARNSSPDIPFDRSINPYRGCEHGCIYCFARPSHAFLGLSPGLDFETKLTAKFDAPALLRRELARPSYKAAPIAMGTNTDPYQPVERKLGIMRGILEVLWETRHPVTIVTKSHLVTRDIDILSEMARLDLVKVALSITSLDSHLARVMEPRAATPGRRLDAVRQLAAAGVPVGVMVAPVIPALNDHEMEAILTAARDAGAETAAHILVRLPHEVKTLFKEWLEEHFPDRARRVMNRIRAMRGGRENDPRFGHRMRAQGVEGELLALRFRQAAKRLGFNETRRRLRSDLFRKPGQAADQLSLF